VRKDATVEEVTGYGLFRYWEEARLPLLSEEAESEQEQKWSTVGWGLRIVEDDGEVDEDFPRELPILKLISDVIAAADDQRWIEMGRYLGSPMGSSPLSKLPIHKVSLSSIRIDQTLIVPVKQNTAKAPLIQRRPSRIIAGPTRTRPAQAGRPSFNQQPSTTSIDTTASIDVPNSAMKGSVGLSSALSKAVLLRVRVATGADVHFTTTISVYVPLPYLFRSS
jgi:hypothetical protein